MELNVKEQTEKLQAELAQLANQVQGIDNQLAVLQSQKQQLVNSVYKKTGALELLQSLDGNKPEDRG